jgi:predicted TIM-barrel fold metal-dependent hydrolase
MTITAPERAPHTPTAATKRRYHLISADSHVNEPGDLWTSRVSAKFKDRVPRMQRFEEGDAWVVDGMDQPMPFGLNCGAGMPPEMRKPWMFWEDVRPGGYDPKARVAEMDRDRVDGEVLFPTPRLGSAIFANPDKELHLEIVKAYNDFLCEFAEYDPSRLRGLLMLPNSGVEDCLAEIRRVGERPGIGGFMFGQHPSGGVKASEADDPVWRECVERGIAVSIHVALSPAMPKASGTPGPLPGAGRHLAIGGQLLDMIFSGTFDRHPELHLVAAEVDCGWVPYFKEQIDDNFRRFWHNYDMDRFPSEYLESNVSFTFINDTYGIQNRHLIGVDRMMWSTDYPHPPASWPNSWAHAVNSMAGVPPAERDAMLFGNALRTYGFGR